MADDALFPDKIVTIVRHAVLAPSSHNTQPWRFRSSATAIDLIADRTRALPVNDPDDRELTISCGAALMNVRIAAASEGVDCGVTLLPDEADPDWLARLRLSGEPLPRAPYADLLDLIDRRHTYRKRFQPRTVDGVALAALVDAASAEGARLRPLLTEESRKSAAAFVAEGDAVQWANPSWRRELAAWMHPRRKGDGLVVPGLTAPVNQMVVRTFDMGEGVGARDKDLAEESPLLAILETERDDPRDWLVAGQALQRMLLTACRHGLQASYLNQPVQVPSLRPKLQNLAGASGFPQLLIRLGYPDGDAAPAPRRPIEDVIDTTE